MQSLVFRRRGCPGKRPSSSSVGRAHFKRWSHTNTHTLQFSSNQPVSPQTSAYICSHKTCTMTPNVLYFFYEVARRAQTNYLLCFVQHCWNNSKAKTNNFRFVTPFSAMAFRPWNLPDQKQQKTCANILQWYLPLTVSAKGRGADKSTGTGRSDAVCVIRWPVRTSLNLVSVSWILLHDRELRRCSEAA